MITHPGRLHIEVRWHADAEREERELSLALAETPTRIPSKYFYDELGSRLFEEITTLPEYYLTRCERTLLGEIAGRVAAMTRANEVVELGSGAADKTRILLDALSADGRLERYLPLDVDESIVRRTAEELIARYPGLEIHGLIEDFTRELALPPATGRRLVLFLGSTLGNLDWPQAAAFLSRVAAELGPEDHLLLGLDLAKDVARIETAYNDERGLTARFNRNILRVLNHRFGADFVPAAYDHRAFFNAEASWVEMRLISRRAQRVRFPSLELELALEPGAEILTEISAKYRRESVAGLLAESGLETVEWFTDGDERFALVLLRLGSAG